MVKLLFWIDEMSLLKNFVILGWLALIMRPIHRFTYYLVFGCALIFTLSSLLTFGQLVFERVMNPSTWNFLDLYQDAFVAMDSIVHFRVTELWMGLWMVNDFHTRFTCAYYVKPNIDGSVSHCKYWTEENAVFAGILIITYFLWPVGLIIYFLTTVTYFHRFVAREPINWRHPQHVKMKRIVSAVDYELLSTRTVRFGDSFPENLRRLYRFIRGLVGIVIGLIVFSFYAAYVVYCVLFHHKKISTVGQYPRWPPQAVRVHTVESLWQSMITPTEKRDWLWKLKSYWLQICTFILFGPNGENPFTLFRAMQSDFSTTLGKSSTAGFFPFGDGIGVGSHKYVKAYLESRDPQIMKDFQSLGWSVSSSLIKFCNYTHIFLPNPASPTPDRLLLARKVIHQWLAAFPHTLKNLHDSQSKESTATYQNLFRIVPRQLISEPEKDIVYLAVGETLFFLATGGFLTRDERTAYLDCIKNPFTFLPDWFNFILAGNYKENVGYASYGKFQAAFARHANGPALQAAFNVAAGHMSKDEVIRLITCTFCLGAAPAPAKITMNIVHRLWSDQSDETQTGQDSNTQEKMVDLFYENPRNFIKECARLYPVLPMVSILANENIARDIKTHTGADLPANTRIHCSLTAANRDSSEFTSPDEFNPRRSSIEMGKIMTWNGSESEIEGENEKSRPPRYCPGHDLSLQVMEFVAIRFAPITTSRTQQCLNQIQANSTTSTLPSDSTKSDTNPADDDSQVVIAIRELYSHKHLDAKTDKRYLSSLDGYTRLIMALSRIALKSWNGKPPRAIDIPEPCNLPTQDLHLQRVDGARHVATWDEDNQTAWRFHSKLVNKILNSKLWSLEDHELQFNSLDDMIAWRWKHFPDMPPPNNPHWCGDSNELMSRFAFFGLACHHTRKLNSDEETMELHTATLKHPILKSAYYVNDMTALSLFAVRAPFDRYGAAAYFDSERRLIGIYLSHRNELVMPLNHSNGLDNEWTYAKYMWRSSALAMVTIRDHLLTTHFIEANTLTNISREFLPAAHPLRIFLKPFTYRTVTINYSAATSLVNSGGLCHRIWGFEYDEFIKLCDYVIAHYRFRIMPDWIHDSMKLPQNRQSKTSTTYQRCKDVDANEYREKCPNCQYDLIASVGLNNNSAEANEINKLSDDNQSEWVKHYPIAEDLPAFWKIVRDYVRRFYDIEYGKEDSTESEKKKGNLTSERAFMAEPYERLFISELCKPLGLNGIPSRSRLIDVLTQLICACTGIHEHVGHVSDYLYDPSFIGTKLRRDLPSLLPSVQNYSLMLVLTVLTAMKMPGLMEDWSHLIPRVTTDSQHDKPPSNITEEQVKSHLDNYYLFKQQLTELAEKIDVRHRISDTFPFESFNPRFMECSVSV